MRENLLGLCLVVVALLLQGCANAELKRPPFDVAKSTVDERLLGTWEMLIDGEKIKNDEEPSHFVCVRSAEQPNEMQVTEFYGDPVKELERRAVYSLKIGDATYLSVEDHYAGKLPRTVYQIARYEIVERELRFFYLDGEYLARAIDQGKLKGSYERPKPVPTKTPLLDLIVGKLLEDPITVDTGDLTSFISKHGADAFVRGSIGARRIEQK